MLRGSMWSDGAYRQVNQPEGEVLVKVTRNTALAWAIDHALEAGDFAGVTVDTASITALDFHRQQAAVWAAIAMAMGEAD